MLRGRTNSLLLGFLATACLALAACSGGGDPEPDAGADANDGGLYGTVLCTTIEDCPPKQLCIDGICYLGTPCGSNDDCLEGYSCNFVTNVCVPAAECESDDDCARPRPACLEDTGRCVGCLEDAHCTSRVGLRHCNAATHTCVTCTQNEHCPEGQFCNAHNTCELPPECDGDADCVHPEKPHCDPVGGHCQECVEPDHCPTDMVCEPESHTCVGCVSHGDCTGEKQICDPELSACVGCLEDADCTAGGFCNPYSRECTDSKCNSDEDCTETNYPYCDLNSRFCVQCISGEHCGYGEAWCRDYRCQTGCTMDFECVEKFGIHQYCNLESGHCFRAECLNDTDCETYPDKPHCKLSAQPSTPQQYSCVACAEDSHCPNFYKCSQTSFTCEIMPCYEYDDPDGTCGEIAPCYSCSFASGQCEPSTECTYPDGNECCQGYSCNTLGHCERNLTCASDQDCPPEAQCNLTTLQCELPSCCDPPCGAQEYCTTDCECLSGCREQGEACVWEVDNAQGNCCDGLRCPLFLPFCTPL